MDNVCCKQDHLKECNIGGPIDRWYLAQWIIVHKFSDILFYCSTRAVEKVNPPRTDRKVCYENMICILLMFEQGQLPIFFLIGWNRSPDYDKAMFHFVLIVNLRLKFCGFPSVAQAIKSARASRFLNWSVFLRYNYISTSYGIEISDDSARIESRIHSKSDSRFGDSRGNLVQTNLDEWNSSRHCDSISRSKTSVPELLETRLEAQQWMIS